MPVYQYKARDRSGSLVAGTAHATDEAHLAALLEQQGQFMTRARAAAGDTLRRTRGGRVASQEIVAFCYQLQTIAASGVPLLTGLQDLSEQSTNQRFRSVLLGVVDDIQQGAALSDALDRSTGTFPRLLISLARAGEATGRLDVAMGRAGDYLQWWAETRSALLQATIYPAVLMTAVTGLIVLLLTFLVPRITTLFSRMGSSLPLPTRMLMATGDFLRDHMIAVGCGLVAVVIGLVLARRTPGGRRAIDQAKLRVPVVGPLVRKICAARFTNTLAVLHQAGVGTMEALAISGETVGNEVMARAVDRAREDVKQGHTISEALAATGQYPPLVTRMIAVGEQTGALDTSLERVNAFYGREVSQGVKSLVTVLEPAMVAFAGGAVGFILLCCFLPLFRLISLLRGH